MSLWNKIRSLVRSSKGQPEIVRRSIGISGGSVVHEDTAMKVAAYYRGLIYISTQIAKLPWEVKDADYESLEDGIYRLLNVTPNGEMTAFAFRLYMIQTAINHGNSYAEIERDLGGRPIGIWPIPHENVDLVRGTNGQLLYRVRNSGERSDTVYLQPRDVFHVRNFHTKDGLMGQGLISYAVDVLGITIGADRMAGNLFSNGGIPSGVLEVKGTLDDAAFARIKESWNQAHTGKKTSGVAILEEGITFKGTTIAPDLLQFLDSRKFGVLEISRFLGLPPTKLFDNTAATYNNIENSNLEVTTDTLDAWARNLESEADWKLLTKGYGGKYTEFDLYAIARGDMKTRSDYFKTMMSIAALQPNEARKLEGKKPYEGGDRYYIANNNFAPVDRIDEVVDAQIASKTKPEPSDEKPADDDQKELARAATEFLRGK